MSSLLIAVVRPSLFFTQAKPLPLQTHAPGYFSDRDVFMRQEC